MRWRWPLPIVFLVLAGCATVSNPSASDQDKPLYPGPQSNVASLSEVIAAHPDDPQAYNMRGCGLWRSRPH